jgi:hypothetical protein
LTCRSWYITVVPYLHHTLVLRDKIYGTTRSELKPLSKLHELGLIPLVREIQVDQWEGMNRSWFVPQAFSPSDLRHFSAFTNVHTLIVQNLEIGRFIPGVECYFEQFSPTLQSIALSNPTCSTLPLDNLRISSGPRRYRYPTVPRAHCTRSRSGYCSVLILFRFPHQNYENV